MNSSATADLAEFAAGLRADDLPRDVATHARRLVLDTLACALGGIHSQIGQIALAVASAEPAHADSAGTASVVGLPRRVAPLTAAAANGRLAAALDGDDTFPSAGQTSHHGSSVVAAALAFAERCESSGAELLAAVAAGHEIGARIGIAAPVRDPGSTAGWRVGGGAAGVLGSAVAAGRILGLDASQMEQALGIAATRVVLPPLKWLGARVAPMVKSMDIGLNAALGAESALLASFGLTGHAAVLDGDDGLWRALGYERFDFDALTGALGTRWALLDARFKRWPCQYWMQPALYALDSLLPVDGEIDAVVLWTNPRSSAPRFRDQEPEGAVTCQFNLPHAAAMLVLGIPPGPRWYAPETLADPRVAALRRRVRVELDPRSADLMAQVEAGVIREPPGAAEIRANGITTSALVGTPAGSSWWAASDLGDDDLQRKLELMTAGDGPELGPALAAGERQMRGPALAAGAGSALPVGERPASASALAAAVAALERSASVSELMVLLRR